MGLIWYLGKNLFLAAAFFLFIVFFPGLPPDDVTFTPYSLTPSTPLKGPLKVNGKLDGAIRLFENELKGPEGLAVYNNELYSGVHGGMIIKIINDKQFVPVLKFGKTCDGLWEEDKCGRPLGLTFDKTGILYAVDAYYGLYKVNITAGSHEKIVAIDEIIDGKPVKLPNSVDVASDGNIYWSVSSTTHKLYDGVYVVLVDATGRLIKTNLKEKTHEVLVDNIHFANGVVLSEDESFVLVAETARARVLRYHLKGPKKGTQDVFIDGLPGVPDNLKRAPLGGFFIPLIKPIEPGQKDVGNVLGPYPLIRKFVVRVFTLIESTIKFLDGLYPSVSFQRAIHFLGHFESVVLFPKNRVTVLRVDSKGNVVESLHSTDGNISDICDIEYFKGAYYLASPFNPYLGKVVTKLS